MESYYLTCRSLTYAQRVSRALSAARIRNTIVRTPQIMSREGCGYAVRLTSGGLAQALSVLASSQLSPKKVYSTFGDGRFVEVVQ